MQVELQHRALLQPGVDERIVVVRDDEPTSLLAYALSSRQASHKLLHEYEPCGKGNFKHGNNTHRSLCSARHRRVVLQSVPGWPLPLGCPIMAHARVCKCREHYQFLEEVRAHVLHAGPKPGGQMLGRATLASRSSTDLADQDEAAPSAASVTGREESASSTGAAPAADAADAKGLLISPLHREDSLWHYFPYPPLYRYPTTC